MYYHNIHYDVTEDVIPIPDFLKMVLPIPQSSLKSTVSNVLETTWNA